MVNLWKKYDSKKTYDEYLNSEHKLRKQAIIISHILERCGIKKLNEMENKIRDLTQNNDNNSDVLSPETIEAIDGFKAEMMSTRSQLRSVKFDLRRDVENLKRWVIALNVAIIPIIFAGLALIISLRRKKLFY